MDLNQIALCHPITLSLRRVILDEVNGRGVGERRGKGKGEGEEGWIGWSWWRG